MSSNATSNIRCPQCRRTKPTSQAVCFQCQRHGSDRAKSLANLELQNRNSKVVPMRMSMPAKTIITPTKSMPLKTNPTPIRSMPVKTITTTTTSNKSMPWKTITTITTTVPRAKPTPARTITTLKTKPEAVKTIRPAVVATPKASTVTKKVNPISKQTQQNSIRDRSISIRDMATPTVSPAKDINAQFKSTQDFKSKNLAEQLTDELRKHILVMSLRLTTKKCLHHPTKENAIKSKQSEFQKHLKESAKNGHYDDKEFLHNRGSLYLEDRSANEQYDRLVWCPLSEINFYDNQRKSIAFGEMCVRSSTSSVQDVMHFRQGALGDCWFLSALGSLLYRYPHHLPLLVPDQKTHSEGVYQVFLYINGTLVSTLIDDYFPCHPESKTLAFSQALGTQLFAPIIEKALAKNHTCYQALHSGTSLEGFASLTGMATFSIPKGSDRREEDKKILRLVDFIRKGFLVAVGCIKSEDGLQDNHAYSLFRIEKDTNAYALLLWNPWANQSLKGNLERYDLNLAQRFARPKGTFWISASNFLRCFGTIDVCRYRSKWHTQRFTFTMAKDFNDQEGFTVFEVNIGKDTEFDITFYQEMRRDRRLIAKQSVQLLLFSIDKKNRLRFVDTSDNISSQSGSFNVQLHRGRYLLGALSFSHWGSSSRIKTNPSFVISFCGSRKFDVTPKTSDTSLIGDMLIKYCTSPNNHLYDHQALVFPSTEVSAENRNNFMRHSLKNTANKEWAFSGMVVENRDQVCFLEYDCRIPIIKNCFNIRSSEGSQNYSTKDIISPQTCQLIFLVAAECDKNNANYNQVGTFTKHVDLSTVRSKFEIPLKVEPKKQLFAPRHLQAVVELDMKATNKPKINHNTATTCFGIC